MRLSGEKNPITDRGPAMEKRVGECPKPGNWAKGGSGASRGEGAGSHSRCRVGGPSPLAHREQFAAFYLVARRVRPQHGQRERSWPFRSRSGVGGRAPPDQRECGASRLPAAQGGRTIVIAHASISRRSFDAPCREAGVAAFDYDRDRPDPAWPTPAGRWRSGGLASATRHRASHPG